jgi:nitrous oxide reductase accessory protein NosL
MKKTIKTITMVLMFTLLITACDKDKKNDVNTSKEITNKPKVEVQTTIVEVTDATGEPVTNSKGEKVTDLNSAYNG